MIQALKYYKQIKCSKKPATVLLVPLKSEKGMKCFMKKAIFKFTVIIFLLIFYAYFIVIDTIPDNIVLLEGEKFETQTMLGFNLTNENKTLTASSNARRK